MSRPDRVLDSSPLPHPPVNQKDFLSDASGGYELEFGGPAKAPRARAIRDRWRYPAPKNPRADGEMQFIDQTRTEQGIVQFAPAFDHNSTNTPFLPQPFQGLREVDFPPVQDFDFIG